MKLLYSCLLFFLFLQVIAQEKRYYTITLGTNIGSFDHSPGFGPVLFVDYNWNINQYLKISPHFQMAFGANTYEYSNLGKTETLNKLTSSFEPGMLINILPIPNYFDRLRIISRLTYLKEDTLKTVTGDLPNNGSLKQKGVNEIVSLDLYVINLKNFIFGFNARTNTSNSRILLYHFG